jgi:hypothetical protein
MLSDIFALTCKTHLISKCENVKTKVLNHNGNVYFDMKCILRTQTPSYDDYKNK